VGGGCVVVLEKGRWWPGCGVFAEYLGPSVCIQCRVVSTAPSRAVKSPCVIGVMLPTIDRRRLPCHAADGLWSS
jgi:hypothetical protein